MINAGTIAAYLTLNTNKFEAGMKSANAQLMALKDDSLTTAEKIQGVGGALTTIGGTLTRTVTLPLIGAGATAVKFASDYESAFAGVRKTTDATEEEYQKLSDGILEMSKHMPTAATEIAGVMEAAGQLGIEVGSLESFTKTMVMLGDSTNLSAREAAESLAKFANVTNMSSGDYDRLGAVIVDLGNNFATTERDIVDMGTRLAATGNLVGLSQAQIMAVATALSACGIEAEAGGSAISKLLKQIEVAVKTFGTSNKVIQSTGYSLRELEMLADQDTTAFKSVAASLGLTSDELKNYMDHASDLQDFADVAGVTAEEFIQAWGEDAVGALGLFIDGLNDTERNGKSAVEILDEMGIKEVRLSNAVLALASSNGILTESADLANNAWKENTALTHEAEQRYATFESQCKMLWNQVKALGIELGTALMPVAKDLVGTAGDIVGWFASLDDGTKELIVKAGLLAAAAGPVVTVLGHIVTGAGTAYKVVGTLTTAFTAADGGIEGFGAALTGVFPSLSEAAGAFVTAGGGAEGFGTALTTLFPSLGEAATAFATAGGGLEGLGAALVSVVTPTGLAALAIAGVAAAGVAVYKDLEKAKNRVTEFDEVMERAAESSEKIDQVTESLQKMEEARLETYAGQLDEMLTVSRLKDKLGELVDKNGKVIGSKEELQKVIQQLEQHGFKVELNKTGEIIKNYATLTLSVEKYIARKKAQAMLESLDAEYQDALVKKAEYYNTYVQKLAEAQELQKLLNDEDYVAGLSVEEYQRLCDSFQELSEEAGVAFEQYSSACETIDAYDKAMAAIAEEDYATATKILNDYYQGIGDTIKKQSDYAKEEQTKAITELSDQFGVQIQAYSAALQTGNEAVVADAKTFLEQAAEELKAAGVELPEGMLEGIENGTLSVQTALLWLGQATNTAIDKVADDAEKEATEKAQIAVNNATQTTTGTIKDGGKQTAGEILGLTSILSANLSEYYTAISNGADESAKATYQKIENTIQQFKELGVEIPDGFAESIKNGSIDIETAMRMLKDTVNAGQEELSSAVSDEILQMTDDLRTGLKEYNDALVNGMGDSAKELRNEITDTIAELKKLGVDIPDALVEGIEDGSISIEEAMQMITDAVGSANVDEATQKMVSDTLTEMGKLPEGMSKASEDAVEGTIQPFERTDNFTRLKNAVKKLIALIPGTSKEELDEHSPSKVMENIGGFAIEGLILGMDGKSAGVLASIGGIMQGLLTTAGAVNFTPVGQNVIGTLMAGLSSRQGAALALIGGIMTSAKGKAGAVSFLSVGTGAVNAIINGFTNRKGTAVNTAENIMTSSKSRAGAISFLSVGQTAIGHVITGFLNRKSSAVSTAEGIMTSSKSRAGAVSFLTVGQNAIGHIITGMNNRKSTALSTVGSIMTSAKSRAGSVSFVSVGTNMINGIISGLNSRKSSLMSTAQSIASSVSSVIKNALQINSPSRVMMEIGEFTAAGMELGLMKGAESLYETASVISEETAEALSGISSARLHYAAPVGDYSDKLDELIQEVRRLADSRPTMEIDGRPFGRLVREYV